jgi:EAL domain-containing protein (putative c-di-GMP-specific phosphodiesterase class I)/AmiR/NasT family two-component response regulator
MSANHCIRVLIADDVPEVRDALAALIASDADLALVATASDATEAVVLAGAHRPDVAIVDVRMPEGGGARATRGIASASPQTRVLALTAYTDRESVLDMLTAGAIGYLVKGAAREEVLDAIRRSASGERRLSSEVTAEVVIELSGRLAREEQERELRSDHLRRVRRVLENRELLKIVFQPIVDLSSGRTVGVEALSRFPADPEIAPDRWFSEAHALGLGIELEVAAARAAISCFSRLPEDLFLSINLSPEAIAHRPCSEMLGADERGRIVIEVTEHAQIEDYQVIKDALLDARVDGVRLAVDDVGAGFASLRHILELSPDFIKLDHSLTGGIEFDHGQRALAQALITFAAELGATVVAEGVETRQQVEALTELGVRYGQGYHLGRPEPLPLVPTRPAANRGVATAPNERKDR